MGGTLLLSKRGTRERTGGTMLVSKRGTRERERVDSVSE